jgi:dTMP kinase
MIVVLEGLNGCGKSRLAEALVKRSMFERHKNAVVYRDPGSTKLGEQLRSMLKDPEIVMDPPAQMLLFSAARAQVLRHINIDVQAGMVVILDRWWMSTFAYQGAQGVSEAAIMSIAMNITPLPLSVRTSFFLDVPASVAMDRAGQVAATEGIDRFETEGVPYLERVRAQYQMLDSLYLTRVDAARPFDEVLEDVWGRLREAGL